MTEDSISRQAAIDALLHNQEVYSNNFGTDAIDKYTIAIIDNDVQTIAQLPSAEPRWIPVTEQLPEIDTDVLISYRYKEGEGDTSHAYIDITSYGDMYFGGNPVHSAIDGNRIKHWRAPFAYFDSNYEVTAWMPLPQPWKGADDER